MASDADAVLADAVSDVLCQDIRKELAKPPDANLLDLPISELEHQAQQILDAGPKAGRRRRSSQQLDGGRCLSSRSAPEDGQNDASFTESLVKRLNEAVSLPLLPVLRPSLLRPKWSWLVGDQH